MFDHSVYIAAAYGAAAIILAWCALAPVIKIRRVRARLARVLAREVRGNHA